MERIPNILKPIRSAMQVWKASDKLIPENRTGGGNLLNRKQSSITRNLSLLSPHCPDITKPVLKRM